MELGDGRLLCMSAGASKAREKGDSMSFLSFRGID